VANKSLRRSILICKFIMSRNHSQKEKQKTATMTKRITKLSSALLTSALLVLSSIAAAQIFVTPNNAAFAEFKCSEEPPTSEGTVDTQCSGGGRLTNAEDAPVGGFGGHSTCTIDTSTDVGTCTSSGGFGVKATTGEKGGGGRTICTGDFSPDDDPETEEEPVTCSFEAGNNPKR
jgi:hypothetical protein